MNMTTEASRRLPSPYLPAAYLESGPKLVGSLIAGALYASAPEAWPGAWGWVALGPLIAVLLFEPIWRWSFTRVEITQTHLRVTRGAVFRRQQSLAWDDIGAVDSRQSWAFARWRLHAVTLSQAGDERTKVHIRAADDALHRQLTARAGHALGRTAPSEKNSGEGLGTVVYRVTTIDLLLASMMYGQFAIIGGGVAMSVADTLGDLGADRGIARWLPIPPETWALIISAGVVSIGLLLTVVRYASFEVRRLPDRRLIISYGFFSTHTRSLAPGSTIGFVLQRNVFESLLGRVRLSVLTTDSAAQLGSNLVLPSLPRRAVGRLLREALDGDRDQHELLQSSGARAAGVGCLTFAILAFAAMAAGWAASRHGWHPLALLAMAALAVGITWAMTVLLCSQVCVDARDGRVAFLTTHLVQRQTVLAAAAVHVASTTHLGGRPVLAHVHFYAGRARTLRALRFDVRDIDAIGARTVRDPILQVTHGPETVTGSSCVNAHL